MRIVKIEKQRPHALRFIFDDGTYILLDKDYEASLTLKVGDEISELQADFYERNSDLLRCKSRALFYLESGDYSHKKLAEKLLKAGFDNETAEKTLARITEIGLLNDKTYAENLFNAYSQKNVSVREITEKLVNKGISRDIAREVCVYNSVTEQIKIKDLLKKNYADKLDNKENISKVYACLARKGFTYGDIKAVLKQYNEELVYGEE